MFVFVYHRVLYECNFQAHVNKVNRLHVIDLGECGAVNREDQSVIKEV
jgi:hypothetical protein